MSRAVVRAAGLAPGLARASCTAPGSAPIAKPLLAIPVDTAIAFEPRSDLTGYIRSTEDLALCGRGAACTQ
jgi:hypothetical protein